MTSLVLMQTDVWQDTLARLGVQAVDAERGALTLAIAAGVALLGWLAAGSLSRLTRAVLRVARFNDAMRRLSGHEPPREPAVLVARGVHAGVLTLGVVLGFDVLGFGLSTSVGERLRDVLPRVLASALLLVAGVLAAMALGSLTRRFFDSAGLRGGRLRGQIVSGVFTLFAALLALEQLGFAAQFVIAVGIVLVSAAGLGAALAFGLGCRELARDFVVEYLRSLEGDATDRRP
jgi:hypothetical protein